MLEGRATQDVDFQPAITTRARALQQVLQLVAGAGGSRRSRRFSQEPRVQGVDLIAGALELAGRALVQAQVGLAFVLDDIRLSFDGEGRCVLDLPPLASAGAVGFGSGCAVLAGAGYVRGPFLLLRAGGLPGLP